jgi:hypothetical protein
MFCAFFADSALVFNIWLSVKEALPQFCLKSYFETAPLFTINTFLLQGAMVESTMS